MNWAVAAALTFNGLTLSAASSATVSLLYTYDGREYKEDGKSAKAAFVVTSPGGASEFQVAGVDGTEIGAWNGKNQVFLVNGLAVSTEFTSCTVDGEVVDLVAPFKTTAAMATRSVSGKVYQSTVSSGPAWWVSSDGKTMDYLPVDGGGADKQVTASRAGWSVFTDGDYDVFAWPETVLCNSRRYILFHYAVRAKGRASAPSVAKCAIGAKLQLNGNLKVKAGLSGYGWLVQQAGGLTPYMNLGLFTRKGHGGVMEKIDRQPSAMWFGTVETGKTLADHAFDNTPDPAGVGKLNPGHVAVSWQDLDLSSGDVQTMSVAFGNFDAEVMEEDAGDLFVTYTAEGWEGTYDGQPHGISVTPLEPADAKMQYALAKEGPYRDAPYTFTNVNETATDVWFRLDAEGYAAVTNSAKVKISPCSIKLTSGSQSWPYDGAAHSNITVGVEGAFAAGEGVKTNNFATITDVGEKPNSFDCELILKPGSVKENYAVTCVTGTLTVVAQPKAALTAKIVWKYLKVSGTYMAQLKVTCTNGLSAGVGGLRFLFADRISGGVMTAALWDTPHRAAKSTTTTYGGDTYRFVDLDASRIVAENVPVTYGVSDIAASSIPVAERTLELYVRTRVDPATDADNYIGYVSWVSGGATTYLPVVAGAQSVSLARAALTATSPMRVDALNRALAVGAVVAEGSSPYCRIAEFLVGDDEISGRVEVGSVTGGGTGAVGTLGPNATVTLLGAENLGQEFEVVRVVETDAAGRFRIVKPERFRFFKPMLTIDEVVR